MWNTYKSGSSFGSRKEEEWILGDGSYSRVSVDAVLERVICYWKDECGKRNAVSKIIQINEIVSFFNLYLINCEECWLFENQMLHANELLGGGNNDFMSSVQKPW